MKILIFILGMFVLSCKAQTIPLNTDLKNRPLNSYLKDLNNELDPYVGTYQANIEGNQITLYITKEDHKFFDLYNYKYYQDVLIVRYTVKSSTGSTLQSTQDLNFNTMIDKQLIHSRGTRMGMVVLSYNGTNCGIGHGTIYLKKINDTQISWRYYAETSETYGGKCPQNVDKTIYLPEGENLIFNKL
ncbi:MULTISPECIES: DUF6705 family protein [Chryseobacterium]|uniref:DUF6705 domain-containing protein n=1 Tax=Chryseobacterium geocarposphaerae TaxID=1416776 RepID=A0ABU1LG58_9FLAO|nr:MULTISPECIES: DUF6705 family protein [Chryseobacterium]MDR6405711.1 hypothetical protein [Chryseobacterium geocarposphaerae]MDR6699127.1 hypothetical protein [Chryseobacterium ginsenosidimutans]